MSDDIKSPSHYTQGKIEVIDFILDQKFNYCEGNVVKYICRYKHKGTPEKDLLKARQYIDFLLRQISADNANKWDNHDTHVAAYHAFAERGRQITRGGG